MAISCYGLREGVQRFERYFGYMDLCIQFDDTFQISRRDCKRSLIA